MENNPSLIDLAATLIITAANVAPSITAATTPPAKKTTAKQAKQTAPKQAKAPNPRVNGRPESQCMLLIDHREKAVTRHVTELASINYGLEQLETGDYAVTHRGKIIAVIERKSLDDFGASLKDGRHDNKAKLNAMRELTGCRVIYIIEGPEFPAPDSYHGGIAYRNIESAIFHLMIRDNVTCMRTRDTLDTARALTRFMQSMETLVRRDEIAPCIIAPLVLAGAEVDIAAESLTTLALLRDRKEKSDIDTVREMWACFPGISVESASEFLARWSIADIVCGRVDRKDITSMKFANGRAINKKAADSLCAVAKPVEINLLAAIPGISRPTAQFLIAATPLSRLLSYKLEISIEICSDKGRRLGDVVAERVCKLFNYQPGEAAPNAELGQVVG